MFIKQKPNKTRRAPCSRCGKGPQIVNTLCGHCFAADVKRFEERSCRSRLTVGGHH